MRIVEHTVEEVREVKKVIKKAGKYRILRRLTLDGPVYEKYWRFEVGRRADLEMIAPAMLTHLINKGVIEEVQSG